MTLIVPASSEPPSWLLVLVVVAAVALLARREVLFVVRLWRAGQLEFFVHGLQRLPAIRRSHASLRDYPAYPVEIPAGPDSRPGLRVLLPTQPVQAGVLGSDGCRHDFQVFLAKRCFLMASCLGRVDDSGTAWAAITDVYESHSFVQVSAPILSTMAGLPAMSCTVAMGDRWLTQWMFEQDGWLFSAGFLRPPDAPYAVTELALGSLATWTWVQVPVGWAESGTQSEPESGPESEPEPEPERVAAPEAA